MRRRLASLALPYGLIVLAVAIFYGKALFHDELFLTNDIGGSDIMMNSFPARAEMAQALREGRLPLWSDTLFLGFPVAAEGQAGTFYPPNLLAFGLFPVDRAYVWLAVLHVMMAGVFTALYARSLGRSRTSSALAGLVVSLSCFLVAHLKHVNLVASAAWVPLLLWSVERAFRPRDGWRWGVWMGVLWALMILAGHVQVAYLALLVTVPYAAAVALSARRDGGAWKALLRAGVLTGLMVAVGVGLSAVQVGLTREYTALGTRSAGLTYEEATKYDLRAADLLMYVDPYRSGDPGAATYHADEEHPRLFWEDCAYVGILPLALALMGAVVAWRRTRGKTLVALLVLTVLVVLGRGSPVHAFFYRVVPGFDRFRFPQRLFLFTTLSLSVLAAFGLDELRGRLGRWRWVPAVVGGAAILVTLLDLTAFGYRHNPTIPAATWLSEPESVRLLRRDGSQYRVWSPDAQALHVRAYERAKGWKGDLTPYVEQRNALEPNLNSLFGVASAGVYFPVVPRLYLAETTGLELGAPALTRTLALFNVKYVLAGGWISDPKIAFRTQVPGGVRIYENLAVLPRARIVSQAIPVSSPEEARAIMAREPFDPRTMITLEGGPPRWESTPTEGSTVVETRREPGRVELTASLTGRGFLVLADSYYPGWKAWVDGKETTIFKANVCCRAVALDPGRHRVEFRYAPRSFRYGLVVSLVMLAFVMGVVGYDLGRRLRR